MPLSNASGDPEIPPPSGTLRPSRVVAAQPVAGEMVLLHFPSGQYFGLNEVGASAWTHLCATGSVEGAFARLREDYEVDDERLRRDLEALVAELVRAGLLQVGE